MRRKIRPPAVAAHIEARKVTHILSRGEEWEFVPHMWYKNPALTVCGIPRPKYCLALTQYFEGERLYTKTGYERSLCKKCQKEAPLVLLARYRKDKNGPASHS